MNNIINKESLKNKNNNYTSANIKVLKGLDAVRKRPGMYIGDTDNGTGLHHMLFEIIDNSIDEALAGYCDSISVILHNNGFVSIIDNGRGIPTDIHFEEKKSAAEVILTMLHSGAKFDDSSYKISGGLHGVGISVVNALSEIFDLTIYRDGYIYHQIYHLGYPEFPLKKIGKTKKHGTKIYFKPEYNFFKNILTFDFSIVSKRLRELAFLNSGIRLDIEDKRDNQRQTFFYAGGISSYIRYLNIGKDTIHKKIFYVHEKKNKLIMELAMQWCDSLEEKILCYTNNIPQKYGGSHLSGFKTALTRTLNNYIEKEKILRKDKIVTIGEDTRVGLTAILSIKIQDPKFSSQTKNKLISSETKTIIDSLVSQKLFEFLEENPREGKIISEKIVHTARIREAARKIREIAKKQNTIEIAGLSGKLSDCQEKNPESSEIFIVEGDSAGGSAKQARDRRNQAILPIKGKILNIEKASFDKMINSSEIGDLITALGCSIGKNKYDPNKIRYHKIIIMTDADIDGSHIRTLLLTFFYRQMKDVLERGYIYIARPPLYRIKGERKEKYIKDNNDLFKYLIGIAIEKTKLITFIEKEKKIIQGLELERLILKTKKTERIIKKLSKNYPKEILESLMYFKKISSTDFMEKKYLENIFYALESNLNKKSHLGKKYFCYIKECEMKETFIPIIKVIENGFHQKFPIYANFFDSFEYQWLIEQGMILNKFIKKDLSYIQYKNQKYPIKNFYNTIDWLLQESRKGKYIQRYKGLGEMNSHQLWETTMNPKTRNILKVNIKNNSQADHLFYTLMGNHIELRKDFIKKNMLNINLQELDI